MTMNDSAGRRGPLAHRSWSPGDDPAVVLAGARRALFIMVGVLALLWVIQIFNWAGHYGLTQHYGIRSRDVGSLLDIFTAPFLHVSWAHIEGNSGPLFIFGFLAAYRGVAKWAWVTLVIVVLSGLAAWFTESSNTVGVGASGVVFGYFGYIMVRGFFDRHGIDMLVGAVMALCFAYQFTVLLPHAGIGWQAHIGGLVGGVLAGWVFRERRARRPAVAAGPAVSAPSPARPGKAVSPAAGPFAGPRADLHKQLDDLGL
jgi:membrane associated rhomboid family serine protease